MSMVGMSQSMGTVTDDSANGIPALTPHPTKYSHGAAVGLGEDDPVPPGLVRIPMPSVARMAKPGPPAQLHTCGMTLAACTCCRCDGDCGLHEGRCERIAKGEKNKRCSTCTTAIKTLKQQAMLGAERAMREEEVARQREEQEELRDEVRRKEEEVREMDEQIQVQRARREEEGALQRVEQEGLRDEVRRKEEEVREKEEQIQELMGKLGKEHEAAVQQVRRSGRVVVAERGAVEMKLCRKREALLAWLAKTKAREEGSTDPEDGWDIISGKRKVLAVPNPDQLPAPRVEDSRHFDRFRSLPKESRRLVHEWCMRAATWSMLKLPHLREAYAHAFALLYQGPNSPAQVQ